MQIRKDENGNIIQVASMGGIPDGTELDLSDYRMAKTAIFYLIPKRFRQSRTPREQRKLR